MNRRNFSTGACGAALTAAAHAAPRRKAVLEVCHFKLRNTFDGQTQRTSGFLEKSWMPAVKRAGAGVVGAFGNLIAPDSPFLMTLASFPSLAALEEAWTRMDSDKAYQKDLEAYAALPGLGYMRMERSLLRGFDSMPDIEVPPTEGRKSVRIFELRVYESNNPVTLKRKMKMFDDGEIDIFRRVGMVPVFFGETITGRNMPNLAYMVGFDDLAGREKCWGAFGQDPEWKKMRVLPGLTDPEVVSNISNSILRALPFSEIR